VEEPKLKPLPLPLPDELPLFVPKLNPLVLPGVLPLVFPPKLSPLVLPEVLLAGVLVLVEPKLKGVLLLAVLDVGVDEPKLVEVFELVEPNSEEPPVVVGVVEPKVPKVEEVLEAGVPNVDVVLLSGVPKVFEVEALAGAEALMGTGGKRISSASEEAASLFCLRFLKGSSPDCFMISRFTFCSLRCNSATFEATEKNVSLLEVTISPIIDTSPGTLDGARRAFSMSSI